MNTDAIKIEVAQRVLCLENQEVLLKIQNLLDTEGDWYNDLTDEEKASIQKGLEQADRGELMPHEEVMKAFDKWH